MPMHKVFLGIGSNIGNRLSHLQEAVDRLGLLANTSVYTVSSIYMTEPVGETEQNRFYNGVILLETSLPPEELRLHCKIIEQELGRPDGYPRWSPRVIDLDILLYDEQCIHTETLSIPHSELHHRKFVLIPLLDIANPRHPAKQQTILQLLECCTDRSVLIRVRETIYIKQKQAAS
ncbi:MAG: 2-amino-4-hydroxy-6-hydroxymethyldihydropteridine diphosphokinase [Chlorobiaceae bacterium]|nr:2-amino-4-hydroxy-6-hydroxymethyldihydropteridine diphosphokinase [Chlorobiaceae bacterium]